MKMKLEIMSLTGSSEASLEVFLVAVEALATSELLALGGFWCFSTKAEAVEADEAAVELPFFSVPFLCLKVSEVPLAFLFEATFKFVVDPNSATGAE